MTEAALIKHPHEVVHGSGVGIPLCDLWGAKSTHYQPYVERVCSGRRHNCVEVVMKCALSCVMSYQDYLARHLALYCGTASL